MRKSACAIAGSAVLLAACASTETVGGFPSIDVPNRLVFAFAKKPNPLKVLVHIDDGVIVIDQEPIRIKKNVDPVTINWLLDSGNYVFPETTSTPPPISFTIRPPLPSPPSCTVATDKLTLSCTYARPKGQKKFTYMLTVMNQVDKTYLQSDPSVFND